jgi:prolipoprotein diacylglyceryltransferase
VRLLLLASRAAQTRQARFVAGTVTFPVYLDFLGLRLHPHPVFETLGYFTGARVYFKVRRRGEDVPPLEAALWLLVGCIFGAWAGSKLLAWAETPRHYLELARTDPLGLLGGKTIVGGLLGGWAGIEIAKRRLGIGRSTGDAFVWPLALGTAIGRLGCFFTGLSDHTYGTATSLPWGVDFGDGIARHPTQLYESAFVLALAGAIGRGCRGRDLPAGARLRLYFAGYFAFRFLVEFIKPRETPVPGVSAIQLASAAGAVLSLASLRRIERAGAGTA